MMKLFSFSVFLFISIFVSINISTFAKDFTYIEMSSLYNKFPQDLQKMTQEKGGDLLKDFELGKVGAGFLDGKVKIFNSMGNVKKKEKELYSLIDFSLPGGMVLTRSAFIMDKKEKSFYTLEGQINHQNLGKLLLNTEITKLDPSSGELEMTRVIHFDNPFPPLGIYSENRVPLVAKTMFYNGKKSFGDHSLRPFIEKVNGLNNNLSKIPHDDLFIAASSNQDDGILRGISAYISYYHLGSYDLVVTYQLARMVEIPWLASFVVNGLLESRSRKEMAYLIYSLRDLEKK